MGDREAATTSTPESRDDATEPDSEPESKRKPKPQLEQAPGEVGGPKGPEPTRYGDWERNGICTDF